MSQARTVQTKHIDEEFDINLAPEFMEDIEGVEEFENYEDEVRGGRNELLQLAGGWPRGRAGAGGGVGAYRRAAVWESTTATVASSRDSRRGDKATVTRLSRAGREHAQRMARLHRAAADQLFTDRNPLQQVRCATENRDATRCRWYRSGCWTCTACMSP